MTVQRSRSTEWSKSWSSRSRILDRSPHPERGKAGIAGCVRRPAIKRASTLLVTLAMVAGAVGLSALVANGATGTVVSWGQNKYGQTDVPEGLSGVVSVEAAAYHSLALKT